MNANHYQSAVERTMKKPGGFTPPTQEQLAMLNFAMGMAGESGEACDLIKKHVFHGHEINLDKIMKEIGDVTWYCAALCAAIGFSFEEVLAANVEKLQKRYPEGFSSERSINRSDA